MGSTVSAWDASIPAVLAAALGIPAAFLGFRVLGILGLGFWV